MKSIIHEYLLKKIPMNKKSMFVLATFLLSSVFISSCSERTADTKTTDSTETSKVVYTCPMHPEVISDKPGKCPKCGMDLVIKK